MPRRLSTLIASVLALALSASPAFAQFEVRAAPEISASVSAAAPSVVGTAALPRLAASLSAPAAFLYPAMPVSLSASAPAAALPASAAAAAEAAPVSASPASAAAALAPAPAAAKDSAPVALMTAAAANVAAARPAAPGAAAFSALRRWGRFFDGGSRAAAAVDGPAVLAAQTGRGAAALAPSAASSPAARVSVPAPRAIPVRARRAARLGAAAAVVVLALVFAAPAFAAAAPALAATAAAPLLSAAPFSAAAASTYVSALHPAASALAAAVGAVYGLMASRRPDGTAPNSGDIFASTIRYGVLGGAGVYVLLDLAQGALTGFSAATLNPLSIALTTAALGHTAFGGKFGDAATTSADRIMSVFPAAAAALGLHVTALMATASMSWPQMLQAAASGAMSATALASIFYATLFTPGRSDPAGPARMAKGWVLQALMGGLAFAVGSPWLAIPFAVLAVWGFGDGMYAAGREIWSAVSAFLSGKQTPPTPAPAPAPPAPPVPPVKS